MNDLLERLKEDFKDTESRDAYADSVVNALISSQIKALREDRKLTQEKLAELVGTKQSGISRLQKTDYSGWKVETLRKFARAFGVRLRISFEEFGTLINDVGGFGKNKLLPRKFEDDPVFQENAIRRSRWKVRASNRRTGERIPGRRRAKILMRIPKKPVSQERYQSMPGVAAGGGINARLAPITPGNNSTALIVATTTNGSQSTSGVNYGD